MTVACGCASVTVSTAALASAVETPSATLISSWKSRATGMLAS